MKLKAAILATDSREHYRDYANPAPYFGTAPEALLQGLADSPEIEVHLVSCARQPMPSPAQLASNIFFHGLHVQKWGWMRTAYLGCIRAVGRKLREIRPDIVHGQGTERDCALGAVFSGFPNVVTIHGNMAALARVRKAPVGSFVWLAARLVDLTLRRTAGVLCNSEHTERLVKPRARRTWRVPNALRVEFIREPPPPGRLAKPTLVNVGVVDANKRQIELLDLACSLHAEKLEFEWLFLGHASPGNPYAAEFLRRVKPLEQEGFVRYLGHQSAAQLIRVFDSAGALVHFSLEESFGLVIAEALARNLKVFSARVGGIPDIVAGTQDAELFAVDDWEGLKSGIRGWLGRGCPAAKGAAELMRSRYGPEAVGRRHLEIYREVLAAR